MGAGAARRPVPASRLAPTLLCLGELQGSGEHAACKALVRLLERLRHRGARVDPAARDARGATPHADAQHTGAREEVVILRGVLSDVPESPHGEHGVLRHEGRDVLHDLRAAAGAELQGIREVLLVVEHVCQVYDAAVHVRRNLLDPGVVHPQREHGQRLKEEVVEVRPVDRATGEVAAQALQSLDEVADTLSHLHQPVADRVVH
mmetsp:Transcript_67360/g.208399  ORF Transcript_67360/g.208399 Transcript_67360/m.208399 type:complete len:205 (+) Transcript_67360:446-1060(+)